MRFITWPFRMLAKLGKAIAVKPEPVDTWPKWRIRFDGDDAYHIEKQGSDDASWRKASASVSSLEKAERALEHAVSTFFISLREEDRIAAELLATAERAGVVIELDNEQAKGMFILSAIDDYPDGKYKDHAPGLCARGDLS